jgi:hypothetical protein
VVFAVARSLEAVQPGAGGRLDSGADREPSS